jgi:hypothetical protein
VRYLIFLAALLLSVSAQAEVTPIVPPPVHGCGTMAVTTSSQYINAANITLCTGSAPFPTAGYPIQLTVHNEGNSSSAITLCPLGSCGVGEYIETGRAIQKTLSVVAWPPSLIGVTGTATAYLEW